MTGLNSTPHEPIWVLRCIQTLTDISWHDTGYPNFNVPEGHPCNLPQGFQAIVMGYIYGFAPCNLVLYRVWERTNYIEAYRKFDRIYQSLLPGRTAIGAKQLAAARYTAELLNAQVDPSPYGRPWTDIYETAPHILQRASRWMALLDALQSEEILLVDQNECLMDSNTSLGKVIEGGTDEEFAAVKEFLLLPENSVKECCLRLTGVTKMISTLADTPKDTELRRYLTGEIQRRITDVFGPPVAVSNEPPAELQLVEASGVQRSITHIFGIHIGVTDEPPCI